jgi:hypothetical protein
MACDQRPGSSPPSVTVYRSIDDMDECKGGSISSLAYLYVCMHVCMYVYIYVYIEECKGGSISSLAYLYVCMYVCVHTWTSAEEAPSAHWHTCMYVCMYVCVHTWTSAEEAPSAHWHTCMYVCMYVCMCVRVCTYMDECNGYTPSVYIHTYRCVSYLYVARTTTGEETHTYIHTYIHTGVFLTCM